MYYYLPLGIVIKFPLGYYLDIETKTKETAMTSEKYTDRALRAKQVAEKLGVSIPFVWAKCNPDNTRYDATFPKPFKIACNVTVWLESNIDAWLAAQAAKANNPKGAVA